MKCKRKSTSDRRCRNSGKMAILRDSVRPKVSRFHMLVKQNETVSCRRTETGCRSRDLTKTDSARSVPYHRSRAVSPYRHRRCIAIHKFSAKKAPSMRGMSPQATGGVAASSTPSVIVSRCHLPHGGGFGAVGASCAILLYCYKSKRSNSMNKELLRFLMVRFVIFAPSPHCVQNGFETVP